MDFKIANVENTGDRLRVTVEMDGEEVTANLIGGYTALTHFSEAFFARFAVLKELAKDDPDIFDFKANPTDEELCKRFNTDAKGLAEKLAERLPRLEAALKGHASYGKTASVVVSEAAVAESVDMVKATAAIQMERAAVVKAHAIEAT